MKKNFLILSIALLVIAPLFAFKNTDKKFLKNEIIPVKPGNEWRYRLIRFNRAGEIIRDTIVERSYVGDTLVNGERWAKTSGGGVVKSSADGFYIYTANSSKQKPFLKFPVEQNEEFPVLRSLRVKDTLKLVPQKVTVKSNDTTITIADKNYNCLVYHFQEGTSVDRHGTYLESIYYVSPGIGIVKVDTFSQTDIFEEARGSRFLFSSEELVDFSLK